MQRSPLICALRRDYFNRWVEGLKLIVENSIATDICWFLKPLKY